MDSIINMLPERFRRYSTHIDFVGQHHAERVYQAILIVATVVGFIAGYVVQQVSTTFAIIGGGFLLANLILLFPLPVFRQHPVRWTTQEQLRKIRNPASATPAPKEGKKKQ